MSLAFVHRPPTSRELLKLRLLLSTYQDGTGQLFDKKIGATLPGWRDFERAVALALGGEAQESKAIFDVLLPDPVRSGIHYGISCKMRQTLKYVERTSQVTVEVSNSTRKFWDALKANGLYEDNYGDDPKQMGKVLIDLVESWHDAVSIKHGGNVDLTGSFYLMLQWDKASQRYQLFQFPIALPNPDALHWVVDGQRLIGRDSRGLLFEWYGLSGGQLKYYPFASDAKWQSEPFRLEPLPSLPEGNEILRKAAEYFPTLWQEACECPRD